MDKFARRLTLIGIPGIPQVKPGDDLSEMVVGKMGEAGLALSTGDVLVLAHKIVSKAEGRVLFLKDVSPSGKALRLADQLHKDPRKVEIILRESERIVRLREGGEDRTGVLICRHKLGFVSANAAVDESNASETGSVVLLPENPDRSAEVLRTSIRERTGRSVGIVITDSFGRPWRLGIVNVAIGLAGLPALNDLRGEEDSAGRVLKASLFATADELAAASGLIMGKTEAMPVVLIKGLPWEETRSSARDLIRPEKEDLFL